MWFHFGGQYREEEQSIPAQEGWRALGQDKEWGWRDEVEKWVKSQRKMCRDVQEELETGRRRGRLDANTGAAGFS